MNRPTLVFARMWWDSAIQLISINLYKYVVSERSFFYNGLIAMLIGGKALAQARLLHYFLFQAHTCKAGHGGDCHFFPEQQNSGAWLLKGLQVRIYIYIYIYTHTHKKEKVIFIHDLIQKEANAKHTLVD